jgi:hypothetical protein
VRPARAAAVSCTAEAATSAAPAGMTIGSVKDLNPHLPATICLPVAGFGLTLPT